MNTRFREMLLMPASTFLGALLGAVSWLVVYSITSTKALELEVSGIALLGLSMILGELLFGGAAVMHWARKNKPSRKRLAGVIGLCLLAGIVACIVVGKPVAEYAQRHYSYSICRVSDFCK